MAERGDGTGLGLRPRPCETLVGVSTSNVRGASTALGEHVRVARPADLADAARLYVALKNHHRPLQPHSRRYQVPDEEWAAEAERALADEHTTVLVREESGRVVGVLTLSFVQKVWGLSCEIHTLVVDEAARGRGHGTALMRAAEGLAVRKGAKGMRVDVLETNVLGRSFYESLGYGVFAVRYGKPTAT